MFFILLSKRTCFLLPIYIDNESRFIVNKAKKVSGYWSSVGFKIGAVRHFFFCFFSTGKYVMQVYAATKFPIIQSMVAKRGLTNRAKVHTPM